MVLYILVFNRNCRCLWVDGGMYTDVYGGIRYVSLMSIEETDFHRWQYYFSLMSIESTDVYGLMWYASLMSIKETNVNLVVIPCFIDVYGFHRCQWVMWCVSLMSRESTDGTLHPCFQ
jgi:hypothetical protein